MIIKLSDNKYYLHNIQQQKYNIIFYLLLMFIYTSYFEYIMFNNATYNILYNTTTVYLSKIYINNYLNNLYINFVFSISK